MSRITDEIVQRALLAYIKQSGDNFAKRGDIRAALEAVEAELCEWTVAAIAREKERYAAAVERIRELEAKS